MIPTTYEDFFVIFILAWLVYIGVLWVRELWRTNINDWSLTVGNLCICDDCRHVFLVDSGEVAAKCPKCNNICYLSKNKRKKGF